MKIFIDYEMKKEIENELNHKEKLGFCCYGNPDSRNNEKQWHGSIIDNWGVVIYKNLAFYSQDKNSFILSLWGDIIPGVAKILGINNEMPSYVKYLKEPFSLNESRRISCEIERCIELCKELDLDYLEMKNYKKR